MAVNEEPFKPSLLGINATLNVILSFAICLSSAI